MSFTTAQVAHLFTNQVHLKSLVFSGLVLLSSLSHAQTFTGKVVGVTDGDTLTVLMDGNVTKKIRLAAVDG